MQRENTRKRGDAGPGHFRDRGATSEFYHGYVGAQRWQQPPLVNGQASCVLFATPQILDSAARSNCTWRSSTAPGIAFWNIIMTLDPTNVNFGSTQSSSLSVVVLNS